MRYCVTRVTAFPERTPMNNRIPEPWQLADAHYAELEAARERELAAGTCGTCANFTLAPDEWTAVRFGWCGAFCDWTEADHPARDCEDDYEVAA